MTRSLAVLLALVACSTASESAAHRPTCHPSDPDYALCTLRQRARASHETAGRCDITELEFASEHVIIDCTRSDDCLTCDRLVISYTEPISHACRGSQPHVLLGESVFELWSLTRDHLTIDSGVSTSSVGFPPGDCGGHTPVSLEYCGAVHELSSRAASVLSRAIREFHKHSNDAPVSP